MSPVRNSLAEVSVGLAPDGASEISYGMKSLITGLKETEVVKRGNFTLTSGERSDFYFDFKKAYENPRLFKKISNALALKIKGKVTCIAATGYGGIPLATAVSLRLGLPLTLVRSEKRTHGLKKQIEGYVPTAKDLVAVVEDVCTYGTSLIKITDVLKETKAKINGCYVVILRPEMKLLFKYPLYHLIKAKDLLRQ
ncbi:MAG: orotate phosphoribosyltransferase [Candidatus Yanofskybacteria bacterium RIFCSPHIGHO2_02_FULL_41_11]|uniref:Orotate phosphoribosyltransferase n=1 Tax=Candidatus Yanofskybacteria bacterium RIFCSPHIGHO2_02_FULL_41_11 TaxID=1802675 RepID=A0A1F8F9Z3_9BACT|nr:MAG: orotate phosphoribosyltransferase [Candidatus Yanofskybacteria bacterium RIFCSPHIGHO2_02_FULL_41_11]